MLLDSAKDFVIAHRNESHRQNGVNDQKEKGISNLSKSAVWIESHETRGFSRSEDVSHQSAQIRRNGQNKGDDADH